MENKEYESALRKANTFLEDKDAKEIALPGLVVYLLAIEAGHEDKIYPCRNTIISFLQSKNYKYQNISKIIKYFEEMNQTFIQNIRRVPSKTEAENLLNRIIQKPDYGLLAVALIVILQIIPKSANLKMRSQIFLPKKDFLQLKEFLI